MTAGELINALSLYNQDRRVFVPGIGEGGQPRMKEASTIGAGLGKPAMSLNGVSDDEIVIFIRS